MSRQFVDGASCYARTAKASRTERTDLAVALSTADRDVRLAELDKRIADAELQEARAWFNAAQANARLGQKPLALEYAQRAAIHQEVMSRAQELIRSLALP
jgi:hypothetical protein